MWKINVHDSKEWWGCVVFHTIPWIPCNACTTITYSQWDSVRAGNIAVIDILWYEISAQERCAVTRSCVTWHARVCNVRLCKTDLALPSPPPSLTHRLVLVGLQHSSFVRSVVFTEYIVSFPHHCDVSVSFCRRLRHLFICRVCHRSSPWPIHSCIHSFIVATHIKTRQVNWFRICRHKHQ